ncbi:hypothetical protein [Candidatus Avelusimicrobium stercoris]|uniref:hypothetical protein n=1 Tax=Candidatus Avelusimicrobium stercoris TaxID=1947924 RepID=UPI003D101D3C
MNVFKFLKSVSGKVQLTVLNTSVTALAVGGLASATLFGVGAEQGKQELAVRSLSSVAGSASSYEGLQERHGQLTSINIVDSSNKLANPDDVARLGDNGSASRFGLDKVDNVAGSLGQAVQLSGSDGLNMNANVATVQENKATGEARRYSAGGAVNEAARRAGAANNASRPVNTLTRASMGSVSGGNVFNQASGALGGARATGSTSGGSDYQFSGAMPSGSNLVSAMDTGSGARGQNSGFMAGGRRTTVSNGKFSRGGNDLQAIAKRSADVAGNSHRGANEGATAFLAGSNNSGGMRVEGGVDVGTTGSADFKTPTNKRLKSVGKATQKVEDEAKARQKARNTLTILLLASVATTAAAAMFGYGLIRAGRTAIPVGVWSIVAGLAIIAAAAATSIATLVKAGQYASRFGGGSLPLVAGILSGLCVSALGFTIAAAFSGKESPIVKFMDKITGVMKKFAMKEGKTMLKAEGINMLRQQGTKIIKGK